MDRIFQFLPYWLQVVLALLGVVICMAACAISIGTIVYVIKNRHDNGDDWFKGVLVLILCALLFGFFGIALINEWPKPHKDYHDYHIDRPNFSHDTSDDDDYESSPSSSSSSGASSNDGMWSQPQSQSWGGGYSQPQYYNESNYQSHSTSSNESSGSNIEYYTERKHCYRCNGTGTYD